MKVLLYAHDFFPVRGGLQTVVLDLAHGLAEHPSGIEVTVVTNTEGLGQVDVQFPFAVARQPSFWNVVQRIRASDLIHLSGPAIVPLVLGLLMRKPVVVEHHGFQAICPNGQLFFEPDGSTCPGHFMAGTYSMCVACNRKTVGLVASLRMLALTPFRRWLCNRARVNIMPTAWLASLLSLMHARTILHGVKNSSSDSDLHEMALPASNCIFAYQGRLVSTKGVRVLRKAFELLRNEGRSPHLIIIGCGPEEEALKSLAAEFPETVQLLGEVPEGLLDRVLARATTVVMPSLAGEVFGLVAAENMMREKLLIVSDLGALREVVGSAGLLFPAGDASALADLMRLAMDEPLRVKRLASAARVRAKEVFSMKRMIEEHVLVYHEVMTRKGRPEKLVE